MSPIRLLHGWQNQLEAFHHGAGTKYWLALNGNITPASIHHISQLEMSDPKRQRNMALILLSTPHLNCNLPQSLSFRGSNFFACLREEADALAISLRHHRDEGYQRDTLTLKSNYI
eukprot:g39753.t1